MRVHVAVLLVAGLVACGDDDGASPTSGDVVIEMAIDASNAPEIVGTVELTEGSDVVGCESATVLRTATPDDPEGRAVDVMTATCEEGDSNGTFDITMVSDTEDSGTWEVTATTGDFETLAGSGDFSTPGAATTLTLTGSASHPDS